MALHKPSLTQYKPSRNNIFSFFLFWLGVAGRGLGGRDDCQRRAMRMKMRRAATSEYLRPAITMANDTTRSCHSTWTLAHVNNPVSPTANTLSGSGSSSNCAHLRFNPGCPFSLFDSSSSSLLMPLPLLSPLLLFNPFLPFPLPLPLPFPYPFQFALIEIFLGMRGLLRIGRPCGRIREGNHCLCKVTTDTAGFDRVWSPNITGVVDMESVWAMDRISSTFKLIATILLGLDQWTVACYLIIIELRILVRKFVESMTNGTVPPD